MIWLAVDRELQGAKDMQAFIDKQAGGTGKGWYQIVTTPQQARSAIANGQLAVVLGIEVDNLFGCKASSNCTPAQVQTSLNKYFGLGVRHLFPVHVSDNGFGGAAIYRPEFNIQNKLVTVTGLTFGIAHRTASIFSSLAGATRLQSGSSIP